MLKIRGIEVEVDVLEELEPFTLDRQEIQGGELKACSPYRDERNPSFYINVETGLWKDFGAENDTQSQGNLIQLLSFLHRMEYEETEEYLLEKYNIIIDDVAGLELNINLQKEEKKPKTFTREELKPYLYRKKEYLLNRGISEEVQKKYVVGYWKEQKSIALLWLDAFTGKVVAVKFRNIHQKKFFYKRGGQPVSQHIFGLYQAMQDKVEKVYVVESEIDAMYLATFGIPAIALGGSSMSAKQERLIKLSGIETLVIASDADNAGNKLKEVVSKRLGGYMNVKTIILPDYAKDINDVKPEDIKKVTDSEEPITLNMNLTIKQRVNIV